MANVLVIDSDDRLAFEQTKLLRELNDRNNIDHVRSTVEFEKKYFLGETDDTRLTTIDLIILKVDDESFELSKWIKETKVKCKNNNYTHEDDTPLKFVIVKYDDDGIAKSKFTQNDVYDIIYTPIDRLVYLQKLEIILALPGKTSPSFLFREKIETTVDISKKVIVDQISNFGFSVLNPVNIAAGTNSKIYLHLDSKILNVHSKVISSELVENKKYFRIYFSFYGLTREQFEAINLYVKKNQKNSVFIDAVDKNFLTSQENVFLTPEEKRQLNIVVVDELQHALNIQKDIESSISFATVQIEEAYTSFFKRYLDEDTAKPSQMGSPDDISMGALIFSINCISEELSNVRTSYSDSDHFLGHSPDVFFNNEHNWKSIFNTTEAKKAIAEALNHEDPNSKLKKIISLENIEGEDRIMLFETFLVSDEELRFELKPLVKTSPLESSEKKSASFKKIDLLVINKNVVGEIEGDWITRLHEILKDKNLLRNKDDLKILVIDEEGKEYQLPFLKKRKVVHNVFLSKPTSSILTFNVAHALGTSLTKYHLDNISWIKNKIPGFMAKPTTLNSISEYGASITAPTPVAPGVVLYLHGHIFDNADDGKLAIRFYHHEESKENKEQHISHFLYFGISDNFLKFARKWIKDNYANQKQAEEEGR